MDKDKYTDKQVCDILGDNHFSNLLQYVLHMFGTMPESMTEEEIIQYLKMNKKIGIVFKFMPEEVKNWCRKHSEKLCWYDVDCWSNGGSEKRLYIDKVYALPEDYKMEEKSKGEWVEFEINKGKFNFIPSDMNGLDGVIESWWNWQEFLTVSSKFDLGFTAFGGWLYNNAPDEWYMTPKVDSYNHNCHCYCTQYKGSEKNIIPAIPVKIRFWKEK